MKRRGVDSSVIRSVGYERATSVLEVEFNNGGLYRYFAVPSKVYEGLLNAPSAGTYFNENIRHTYPDERVRGPR